MIRCFFVIVIMLATLSMAHAQRTTAYLPNIESFAGLMPVGSYVSTFNKFELKKNGVTDVIFSYVLSSKRNPGSLVGSGILILKPVGKGKYRLDGHIKSKSDELYMLDNVENGNFHVRQYHRSSNYNKLVRKLKFTKGKTDYVATR
ncbi:MAG: hypothetical protein Q4F57_07805 [Weeksellaceae bacterium]|nr:hypothetical protein [Weeksellaceae bacterium]